MRKRKSFSPLIFTSINFWKEREREREREERAQIREREREESGAPRRRAARSTRSRDAIVDRATRSCQSRRSSTRSKNWLHFFCWVLVSFAWFDAFSVKIFEWISLNLLVLFWICVFLDLWLVFSDLHFLICVFLLFFQTSENIFRKIFWNATKYHGNIFLFRKLAFLKNMYFPENVLQQPNTA